MEPTKRPFEKTLASGVSVMLLAHRPHGRARVDRRVGNRMMSNGG
jgi:hypothetical protein